ncbi:S-4TM family putative pore-forming effector [Nocardia amikacinitolerans]|uniref:S-4TM family putative pore-forming effector n=1 Tax=Nocardia amikacinitolerans TaxID=756689 RepID=UPI0036ADC6E1
MTSSQPQRIAIAQNSDYSQRLLAAQSRLYTDAKRIHDLRILTVVVLAIVTIVVALATPQLRAVIGSVGGITAFLWSLLAGEREKRRRKEAASVQEEFDTHVFSLPWNSYVSDHPSPTLIAEAAARYRGNRTRDWYPDTRNVIRPLDVLICQRSNLGWGTSMHRFYAATLTVAVTLMILAGVAVAYFAQFSIADGLTAILIPLLGPVRELVEMIRANRESSDSKAKAESTLLQLWNRAMQDPDALTVEDCRRLQDRIIAIRLSNAHVPDWLDNLRRSRSEAVMQDSADHLVHQAVQNGRTD